MKQKEITLHEGHTAKGKPVTEEKTPERLQDLDPQVRRFLDWLTPARITRMEWLAMRNDQELGNLEHVCDWSDDKLDRLSKLLALPEEEFNASFEVAQQFIRRKWLRQAGMKSVAVVTALIVLYNLLDPYIDAWLKYKK